MKIKKQKSCFCRNQTNLNLIADVMPVIGSLILAEDNDKEDTKSAPDNRLLLIFFDGLEWFDLAFSKKSYTPETSIVRIELIVVFQKNRPDIPLRFE